MADLARAIVSRLRQLVGDRRHAKRRQVRLSFSISIVGSRIIRNGARRVSKIDGHTLDISSTGIALIVPTIRIGEHYLVGENRTLNVKLELPTGPVEMKVNPIRYESLEEHKTETGYLIGARISEMTQADRARLDEYLLQLLDR
jgi:c-di-GMP-binding flagellar brake protein YcgR